MKIWIFIIILLTGVFTVKGQETEAKITPDSITQGRRSLSITETPDSAKIYGWQISRRLADRTIVPRDTALYGFHQSSLVEGNDIAISFLSNIGSPAQSKIFFNREESYLFSFLNTFNYYLVKPDNKIFFNTKVPYSNIFYQRSENGSQNREERFMSELTWNINKKLNIGLDIDYLYARGSYASLASKQFSYNVYGTYISPKYEMHAFIYNNNFINSENGGIFNYRDITDPETNIPSKDIRTTFTRAWNRLKGRQIYFGNRYNIGLNEKNKIPVATLILTSYYADQQRRFVSDDTNLSYGDNLLSATDIAYSDNHYNDISIPADDQSAYWSFKNTFGISLNEGFKDWVKFGLTGYIEQDFRKFKIPILGYPRVTTVEPQNSTIIGGILSKEHGRFLKYKLSADIGILGYNIGEFRATGDLTTSIKFKGKDAEIKANAHIKNLKPTFFENRFNSKYITWDNNFGDIRRVYVGGEIFLPQTKTRIKGGVENIQNYIYYGEDKIIAQEGGSIQVIGIQLDQKLNAGILHWDNQIAYQLSSNTEALPLPLLSFYSNLYIKGSISKVLNLQMGVDVRLFTEYYAPGYDPVLLQFYNQREMKIGNFPMTNAYINLHLKKTRFFIMMYNIAQNMGNRMSFTTPFYPINPMMVKLGLSWNFDN